MSLVRTARDGGVLVVTVDDGKANAIQGEWLAAVDAALDEAEADGLAVVLAGRARVFSAGLDVKRLPGLAPAELRDVLGRFGAVMLRLFTFPRPIVAAVEGHALAGGMVTLLGCDARVVSSGPIQLGLNETQIGLPLPRFVAEMARAQVPAHQLHTVVVRGAIYGPDEALRLGVVDRVVAPEAVLSTATALAAELAALPAQAYAANKALVRSDFAERGRTSFETELDGFVAAFAERAAAVAR